VDDVAAAAAARPPRPRPHPVTDAEVLATPGVPAKPDAGLDDRPLSEAPWRCATRYTDDSPIPNRLLISETGVSVSAYSRVTSRSCASVSLRRVVPLASLAAAVDAPPSAVEPDPLEPDVSLVTITSPISPSDLKDVQYVCGS
jgi:hypothetical protein